MRCAGDLFKERLMQRQKGACLICGEPLVYLKQAEMMKCSFCGKEEPSYAKCGAGHYVCDACHARQGIESIMRYCAAAAMSALPDLTQPFCEKDNPAYENHLRQSVQFAYGSGGRKPHDDRTLLELGVAQQQAGINLPPLLFHYGEQDVRYQVQYIPFKRFCEAYQLPVTFATAPGEHGFGYWEPTVRQILHWFKDLHQQG